MKFEEWLYEVEAFSTRIERMFDEIDPKDGKSGRVIRWLNAAYEVGLEEGKKNDS